MSVSEAAEFLGISVRRVRQLIEQEVLPASRIGRAWAIDSAAVDRRLNAESPPGRPYSPRSSWGLAALADVIVRADDAGRAQAPRRSMRDLRNLLAHEDSGVIAAMLRSRANRVEHRYVHHSLVSRLAGDARLVISGARAAENVGNLIADDQLEAYVKAGDLAAIHEEYGLQSAEPDRANVILRVVAGDFLWEEPEAPLLLIAADLRERDDARAREASNQLFRRIQSALEAANPR